MTSRGNAVITKSLLFIFLIGGTSGFAAQISSGEAIAVADLWYCMELNSGYLEIDEAERSDRLNRIHNRHVFYLVGKDELLDRSPIDQDILAYVITYDPTGFVIVSGDDCIEPVISFSVKSQFRWDKPEVNFLRHLLNEDMIRRWANLGGAVNQNWVYLRSQIPRSLDEVTFDARDTVYILLPTPLWGQGDFYNDTVVAHNGNNDSIPTGCMATAMAIKMKFHESPINGHGSHSYTDTGSVAFSHSVNYGIQTYVWSVMPTVPLTCPNVQVARLMYHVGVAVNMDYEVGASAAYGFYIPNAMNDYFRYRGTIYIESQFEDQMKESIIGWLPVQFGGSGHSALADGYREPTTQYFHINCGFNGVNNGWYNLDSLPWDSLGGVISGAAPYSQPGHWEYVDGSHSGYENGNIRAPYNAIIEGDTLVPYEGTLMIKQGTYTGTGNVPITFHGFETIRSYVGTAVIGDNISLTTDGAFKLYNTGDLKIY